MSEPVPSAPGEAQVQAVVVPRRRRSRRRWLLVPVALVLAVVLYVGGTFVQVWRASGRDARRPAEAIVVLGAAQYDGKPSPALKNRLDHALALYREGLAPTVVVTGGRQVGDRFTEATTGYNYLRSKGVPDAAILKEVQGRTTYESLAAVSRFLAKEGIDDVLLVSGPAHSKRLAGIASQVGLHAAVSPASGSPDGASLVRETVAVSAGRLIGYRRLERLDR
ncbi:YdcF family protein [soil metagenome]